MKLSIVVPCYNEAENIPLILQRFQKVSQRCNIEVILVDNGSTDHTQEVLAEFLPEYPFARSIHIEVNQGYGYGIVQGLNTCRGKFIGWTHADMQTDPVDFIKALYVLEKYHEDETLFIKGTRKGRPLSDLIFTMGMSIFETAYLGEKLYDVNAQPNLFSRKFFNTWKNPPKDFALDLYALYMAQKQNLQIRRFAVAFPQRMHGSSHWNHGMAAKGKFIKRTIVFSRKLKKEGIC